MYSLVIRGGTIIDGSGSERFEADVAIDENRIVALGANLGRGEAEIDARGKFVTPGFVDTHTHYDAQVTWSSQITPSSWNGVTTAMIGNCGVGFAPCLPERRDMLVKLMEGVEDIPEVVLTQGLPWNWASFPEYLDVLGARCFDLDVATQVPHSALRVHVMGQRGAEREPATAKDRAEMARLAAEGIRAGALGFSTSRTINHRTLAGELIPTLVAAEAELIEIAEALGSGWLQVISDFDDPEQEFSMLRRVASRSGRPVAITVLQRDAKPEAWRELMARISRARADGVNMIGQVIGRPTGVLLGFEISTNPFSGRPSWESIAHLPLDQKLVHLRDAKFRQRLLGETNQDSSFARRVSNWERIFPFGDPPDYEPPAHNSIAAIAARAGRSPAEVAYDLLLSNEGRTILYRPLSNYAYGSLDTVKEMITHPDSIVSLGDGGAHVGVLTDASAITYLLTHWTRDRNRGERLPLEWAVKRLSSDNARAIGLFDRGVLRPGAKADVNVIDYERLALHVPEVSYDLPGGGRRLLQRTSGYEATILSGRLVHREGVATGELPGRLVRGPQSAR